MHTYYTVYTTIELVCTLFILNYAYYLHLPTLYSVFNDSRQILQTDDLEFGLYFFNS